MVVSPALRPRVTTPGVKAVSEWKNGRKQQCEWSCVTDRLTFSNQHHQVGFHTTGYRSNTTNELPPHLYDANTVQMIQYFDSLQTTGCCADGIFFRIQVRFFGPTGLTSDNFS